MYKLVILFFFLTTPILYEGRYRPAETVPKEKHTTVLENYEDLSGKIYLQAEGKALKYPTQRQLKAETCLFRIPFKWLIIAAYACAVLLFQQRKVAWFFLLVGFLLHTLVLGLRCYVLLRPPVSNMMETLLYVPWIAITVGLFFRKILPASLLAAIVLLFFLPAHQGLENVQAVLDSNYWLIVHVMMVVGSYGVFCVASVCGHFFLLKKNSTKSGLARISHTFSGNSHTLSPDLHRQDSEAVFTQHCPRYPDDESQVTERRFASKKCEKYGLEKIIIQTLYLGTSFLIGGTILGGVWAAESWGRFWDWDPKEAWAFISSGIYLVCIHLYRFKKIGGRGLAAGAVIGFMSITFTWYGVNYILGTGLHSYGFGQGGEIFYYLFLAIETLFLSSIFLTHLKLSGESQKKVYKKSRD